MPPCSGPMDFPRCHATCRTEQHCVLPFENVRRAWQNQLAIAPVIGAHDSNDEKPGVAPADIVITIILITILSRSLIDSGLAA